jgi:hypothetical protein
MAYIEPSQLSRPQRRMLLGQLMDDSLMLCQAGQALFFVNGPPLPGTVFREPAVDSRAPGLFRSRRRLAKNLDRQSCIAVSDLGYATKDELRP